MTSASEEPVDFEDCDPALHASFFEPGRTPSERTAVEHLREEDPKYARRCLTDEEIAQASLTSLCRVEFEDLYTAAMMFIVPAKFAFVAWVRWIGFHMLSFDIALLMPPVVAIAFAFSMTNNIPMDALLLLGLPLDCVVVSIFVQSPTNVCVTGLLGVMSLLRASIRGATVTVWLSAASIGTVLCFKGSLTLADIAILLLTAVFCTRGSRLIRDLLLQLSTERIKLERQERIAGAILGRMLPPQVTHKLKDGIKHIAYSHDSVTILFAEIQNVSQYAEVYHAESMVHQMNLVFSRFDQLMQRHAVYKIETVGDVYVACSGVPQANPKHAERCAGVALAMLDEIQRFIWPDGRPMEIKVGMHSGPIVSGVIGELLPRYRLFGDTINTASRMCSHNPSTTRVMCSEPTKELLEASGSFELEQGGAMNVKGKGELNVHFVVGAREQPAGGGVEGSYQDLEGHALYDDVDSLGYDVAVRLGKAEGRLLAFAVGELLLLIQPEGGQLESVCEDGSGNGVVLSSLARGGSASVENSVEMQSKGSLSLDGSLEMSTTDSDRDDRSVDLSDSDTKSDSRSFMSRSGLFSSWTWGEPGTLVGEVAMEKALIAKMPIKLAEGKYAISVQTITGITHTMERSTIKITSSACDAVELTFAGSWLKHEFVSTLTEFTGHQVVDDDLFGDDTGHHNGQHWSVDPAVSSTCRITGATRMADLALGLPVPRSLMPISRTLSLATSLDSTWQDEHLGGQGEGKPARSGSHHAGSLRNGSVGGSRRVMPSTASATTSLLEEAAVRTSMRKSLSVDIASDHARHSLPVAGTPEASGAELHVERTYSSGFFGANDVVRLRSSGAKHLDRSETGSTHDNRRVLSSWLSRSAASMSSMGSFPCSPRGEAHELRIPWVSSRTNMTELHSSRSLDAMSAAGDGEEDGGAEHRRPLIRKTMRRAGSVTPSRSTSPKAGNSPCTAVCSVRSLPSAELCGLDRIASGEPYIQPTDGTSPALLLPTASEPAEQTETPFAFETWTVNEVRDYQAEQLLPSYGDISASLSADMVYRSPSSQVPPASPHSDPNSPKSPMFLTRLPAVGAKISAESSPKSAADRREHEEAPEESCHLSEQEEDPKVEDEAGGSHDPATSDLHAQHAVTPDLRGYNSRSGSIVSESHRHGSRACLLDDFDDVDVDPPKQSPGYLAPLSAALIRMVELVLPEGKAVRPVAPLTRKTLWKISGGKDTVDSFAIRDNKRQAEIWTNLLASLRRHGKHGWALKPFSHPLLRSTFAEQCALRVRPSTVSAIRAVSALLVGFLMFENWASIPPQDSTSDVATRLQRDDGGRKETCTDSTGTELAFVWVAGWIAVQVMAAGFTGYVASRMLSYWIRGANRRGLRNMLAVASTLLHLFLAIKSLRIPDADTNWPRLLSTVVLVGITALQQMADTQLHVALAVGVWTFKALVAGGISALLTTGGVGVILMLAAYHLELIMTEHFRKVALVQHEITMTLGICRSLLPGHVIDHMVWSNGKSSPCDRFEEVTILFADIVGFTSMSSKLSPQQLVDLLNNVFSLFDRMALKNKVYKVETIGDCYFCATGLPVKDEHHADNMLKMALDMLGTAENLTSPAGDKIQFRIGIHSGSTVAGVMGENMPRYHLFGKSVRLANELEQGGKADKIHVSESTSRRLSPEMKALMQGDDPVVFCSATRGRRASLINKA